MFFAGKIIADTVRAWRVLETSHPPTYYIPPEDIRMEYLEMSANTSFCEWKGAARYYTVRAAGTLAVDAAWTYHRPTSGFAPIRDHVAFYAGKMERCLVDGEIVTPQPGGFYGGWVTSKVVGPFKGEPGTMGW